MKNCVVEWTISSSNILFVLSFFHCDVCLSVWLAVKKRSKLLQKICQLETKCSWHQPASLHWPHIAHFICSKCIYFYPISVFPLLANFSKMFFLAPERKQGWYFNTELQSSLDKSLLSSAPQDLLPGPAWNEKPGWTKFCLTWSGTGRSRNRSCVRVEISSRATRRWRRRCLLTASGSVRRSGSETATPTPFSLQDRGDINYWFNRTWPTSKSKAFKCIYKLEFSKLTSFHMFSMRFVYWT